MFLRSLKITQHPKIKWTHPPVSLTICFSLCLPLSLFLLPPKKKRLTTGFFSNPIVPSANLRERLHEGKDMGVVVHWPLDHDGDAQ